MPKKLHGSTDQPMGHTSVPRDSIKEIYDDSVFQRWRRVPDPSEALLERIEILQAHGPTPSDPCAADRLGDRIARKAAWEAYLDAAFAIGMFEGNEGHDLRQRLTSTDDATSRGAMAECLAAWVLAGKFKFTTIPYPPGKGSRTADLAISLPNETWANVEVKAPFHEWPVDEQWWGSDADVVARCLSEAYRQLPTSQCNIVLVVPQLPLRVYQCRDQLVNAFIGRKAITVDIDEKTGSPASDPRNVFVRNGKFLQRTRPDGRPLKPDRRPKYTRISAVISVEERIVLRHAVDHKILVVHNPYAQIPIETNIFPGIVQLICEDNSLKWTDGHPVLF